MTGKKPEVVIPAEKAVFRLDGRGCWRNEGGKFQNKKIIDHFNRCIAKDANGYFVVQDKGGVIEKVYFFFEDTALFVFDVLFGTNITLVLNTGDKIPLLPEQLVIRDDALYVQRSEDRIKFTERAMMKLARTIEETTDTKLVLRFHDRSYIIPETTI